MKFPRFSAAVFLIGFCCTYVFVFTMDWPLFRYYPLHGDFNWGARTLKGVGPAMTWYGMLCSSSPIAAVVALIIPDRVIQKPFGGYLWLFPCAAMLACVFLLRVFFV
jgi:hypothetical protein